MKIEETRNVRICPLVLKRIQDEKKSEEIQHIRKWRVFSNSSISADGVSCSFFPLIFLADGVCGISNTT